MSSMTPSPSSRTGLRPVATRRVCIVQRIVPHYRVPFFRGLQSRLAESGVELKVIHGQEYPGSVPRGVAVEDEWSLRIRNRYLRVARHEFIWQPCSMKLLGGADLIIVEHANRLLLNYLLLVMRRSWRRLAFWGHGANFQAPAGEHASRRLARGLARQADWWFTYTQGGAALVEGYGYPSDRLTVVNNAIDSRGLADAVVKCGVQDRVALRERLRLPDSGVAIFCGRLVKEKRLDLLWSAALELRARFPRFALLVVGDGPLEAEARHMAAAHEWIHCLGALSGEQLAPYLAVSDLLLIPGLVGLVVVDALASGLPLVTCRIDTHSPEIEYLEPGVTGLMADADGRAIADTCESLLHDPELLARMRASCLSAAREYTIEAMVGRFAGGVLDALERAPRGAG